MSKKALAAALGVMGMLTGMQNAVAEDNLFKKYAYDTPIAKYTEAAGYYDCSTEIGATARCLDDVDFLDQKFTAALLFSGDKLMMVSLFAPYDRDLFGRAIGALAKTFTLVSLADGKSVLDIIEFAGKAKNKDEYTAKLTNYENVALAANELTYSFVEGLTPDKRAANVHSLMKSAPANIRGADLIVSGEGDESSIIIKFSFPKLDENKLVQQAKKPVESF
ncbi:MULTISPECIES: hypothetical protein [Pseudomonas]|uniref:Uncharacterized protein n=1 Tax=Pseudomonas entomophila TaxID=312306 RepID=A0A3Q8U127_9PSED|nr:MULTISPECIES: hypothetical protein [Pseudomonas]AZL68169.1 hypothetical protein EJA05_10685 [Pseudomonas oryziphila]MDZ4017163.1 hypothetical protein [Pseudomonas sichuanensis]